MQLIKKLFGRPAGTGPGPGAGPESAQFHESEVSTTEPNSRNAPRRELVQVVLRDTIRRHGIPSAWIDCRILTVVNRNARSGMHVELIVRDGMDRLLTYVPAFQGSFMQEIERFDPRVHDWLFSISWQFQNIAEFNANAMPDPGVWAGGAASRTPTTARATAPVPLPEAVRPATEPSAPTAVAAPSKAPAVAPRPEVPRVAPVRQPAADAIGDQEVLEDLQALYAIRDAALEQPAKASKGPSGERDFESTRPGADDSAEPDASPLPRRW